MPCKDGYVVTMLNETPHWRTLTQLMGRPKLAEDPRFASHEARARHGGEVNRLVAQWATQYTKSEIHRKALEVGCPIGFVATPEEVVDSPHAAARGLFHKIRHGTAGTGRYAALPFLLAGGEGRPPMPAPLLGEHTRPVLQGWLGLSEQEVDGLAAAGVLE